MSSPLRIAKDDRVLAVGRTGTGKTTLLRTLAEQRPYRVIIDTKQDPRDGWHGKFVDTPDGVKKYWRKEPVVYQPRKEFMRPQPLADFFGWWYDTVEDILLVVDELATRGMFHATMWSPDLDLLYRQGRGRKQPVWGGSQRPMNLKNEAISESDHTFQMHLKLKGDREKMAGLAGDDPRLLRDPETFHGAWYIGPTGKVMYMPPIARRDGTPHMQLQRAS